MTEISRFTFEQIQKRLKMKLGEDESLEFKTGIFENKKGIENPILKTIAALANTHGGNLIIGIKRQNQDWIICGTSLDQECVSNWLDQIMYEYVEPDGLSFEVYPIESAEKDLKCIGIVVHKLRRYFAVRYSGRSSKSEGKSSYYFPMRIGSSSRLLDSFSFIRNIFSDWAMGLSEISKQEIFKSFAPREERKFDLEDFRIRISELGIVEEERTRKMLIEELRDILTNLPLNHSDAWTDDLRKPVFELLDILQKEIQTDGDLKNRILNMLSVIAYRADDKTLKKMEHDLLGILEESYAKKSMRKTSDLIHLLQVLHNYDPDYMDKMIKDALENWDINDFANRLNDIEVGKHLSGHIDRKRELRLYVLKKIEIARKTENHQMQERFEKMYNIIRSVGLG
jgi:hypothetical protein